MLKKQTLGNSGDYYEFEYDTKNQLTAIKINSEKVEKFEKNKIKFGGGKIKKQ